MIKSDTNISLSLSSKEIELLRNALRLQEESYKRNDFRVMVLMCQELRSKIVDAMIAGIDKNLSVG